MNSLLARKLYPHLPTFLQNLAVSIRGWQLERQRFGGHFSEYLRRACEREEWAEQDLANFRERRLSRQLRYASNSPFWQKKFSEYGVDPASGAPVAELRKLPIITKNEIKRNIEDVPPSDLSTADLLEEETSGTTGSGLSFPVTRDAQREQWAIWWRYRRRHGITRDTRCGYFGGRTIVPRGQSAPPYWRLNYPGNQILFSIFHLSRKTVGSYLEAIRQYELPWLHGYPSALALLSSLALETNAVPLKNVQVITTGAESLLPQQRELIEKAFDAPVHDHYGLAERVANISECSEGTYHVDEDFAITELVPTDADDNSHRIIGTTLTNPAFPLFRYDTSDMASLHDTPNCACGSAWREVRSIDGRIEDYITLPSGERVGRLDHIFKGLLSVQEAQIYQPAADRVVLRIVPVSDFDQEAESLIRQRARSRLGHEITITTVELNHIPRTAAGKIRFVVSDVDADSSVAKPTEH